jgi:PAS domain S-box-containing protein
MTILLGGVVTAYPVYLAISQPGATMTRFVVAVGQMAMSGILIHISGGRIETHFHIFGSLAFLAFYRDWRVIVLASAVTAADHFMRGIFWPLSLFGTLTASPWRALEHASWVIFEDFFLLRSIGRKLREMKDLAERQTALEAAKGGVEEEVRKQTAELKTEIRMRRGAEALLRQEKDLMRLMFEQVPAILWTTDADSKLTSVTGALGVGTKEQGWGELLESLGPEKLRFESHRRAIAGQSIYFESDKDGRYFQNLVEPLRDSTGGVIGCIGMALDITDRKRTENERTLMEVQLRQAQKLESIGQLAAGIAHEINTPTQFIGDNARFLRDGFRDLSNVLAAYQRALGAVEGEQPTGSALASVRDLERAVDLDFLTAEIPLAIDQTLDGISRVSALVRAMKEFSHPGTTAMTEVDLNTSLANTLTVCRNEWKYVADVVTAYDPLLPAVPAFPGELNQVFLNLIVNAAHAIGEVTKGSGKGTITVSTAQVADWAEVRIIDTGSGIPEEIRGRVFDPFFTTKGVGKGTGQGLAIAWSMVVDKHHGQLFFETECGHGTAFVVRLPLRQVTVPEAVACAVPA